MKQSSTIFVALSFVVVTGCSVADLSAGNSTEEGAQTVCAGPTVAGVDVSEFQGNIDWNGAHANGIDFAVIRIGDGFYDDPKFVQNWNDAAGAGVLRGAYQFFRAGDDPGSEANHFADILMANGGPGELPPVADVEVSDGVDPGTYAAHLATWLQVVELRTGVRPAIYTGKYFWQDNVGGADDTAYPLWVAQWGPSCPDIPSPWGGWTFWQTHDDGQVGGIPATVDLDVFNGTIDQLRSLRADPQCLADPNTGGCDGTVVTACDSTGHLGTGDCGFFGAGCSTEGGHPHCVHPYCPINLDGAEDGSFCNGETKLDTCALGQLSEGDCGAYGATCVESGDTAHCNHFECWTHLNGGDTGNFCVDGTKIGTCDAGVYSEGDCGFYGAECGTEGGTAHCVHFMCWTNLNGAEDGSFCKDDHTLGSCAVGAYTETDCGSDGCSATADGARCAGTDPAGEGEGAVAGEGESGGGEGGAGDGGEGGAGDGGEGGAGGAGDGGEGGAEGAGDDHGPTVVHPASCAASGTTAPMLLALGVFLRRRRR